jgi:cell division protein FtsL
MPLLLIMTKNDFGTMNKTVLLFMLLIASAMVIWWMAFNGANPLVPAIGGAIAGLV